MGEILFCPFCRESFEGQRLCPEHELPLVPVFELPPERRAEADTEPLSPWDPGRGRGAFAASALLSMTAFVALPLAQVQGPLELGGSMLRLALEGTPKLWLIPAAAGAQLMLLHRRRTPRALRGARLAAPLLALVPVLSAAWTWRGITEAVALLAERTAQPLTPRLASGAYLLAAAGLLGLVAGLRLGVDQRRNSPQIQG
ncbi:MAG: hypothetical protein PVI30_00895 [Myxococcales bacterium]|jgi:hypothetical protein